MSDSTENSNGPASGVAESCGAPDVKDNLHMIRRRRDCNSWEVDPGRAENERSEKMKMFTDASWGGPAQALKEALKYRNRVANPPKRDQFEIIKGISVREDDNRHPAFKTRAYINGKVRTRERSMAAHGFYGALRKVARFRWDNMPSETEYDTFQQMMRVAKVQARKDRPELESKYAKE